MTVIIIKILTWLQSKIFRKEKPTNKFETKNNNSNFVININIEEFHSHNSFSSSNDMKSEYNKSIKKYE